MTFEHVLSNWIYTFFSCRFGFGLSYTKFAYSALKVQPRPSPPLCSFALCSAATLRSKYHPNPTTTLSFLSLPPPTHLFLAS